MDLKRNERFYKQNDMWRLLGGGLLIVGFIWLWVGRTMASYYLPIVMIPAGFVMFLVTSARNVPESEIRGHIQKAVQGLGNDITEHPDLSKQVLNTPAPYRGEAFAFDERMKVARRGKDAKLLSDVFCATAAYFTKDALLLRGRVVNLSDGTVQSAEFRLLWEDVGSAALEPYDVKVTMANKRRETATARGGMLTVTGKEGELLYSAPVPNDMDGEDFCKSVMRMAQSAQR